MLYDIKDKDMTKYVHLKYIYLVNHYYLFGATLLWCVPTNYQGKNIHYFINILLKMCIVKYAVCIYGIKTNLSS